jgi:beta-lactamase superfamily II metal-dependent hydrolase
VISLGQHNKYGFPKQVTLDTLDAQNIKTLRTDEEGTITFVSDGKQFMRVR